MIIKKIPVGYLQANCYVLNINNEYIIIDPGDEFDKIKSKINGEVVAILITHYHFDHIGALNICLSNYKAPVYDYKLEEKKYNVGLFSFKIIKTKGHTSDSVSFLFDDNLFTGDFIFRQSIGRTDLETGNMDEMIESIRKIKTYPNITIYPGHGDSTSLDYEKKHNPYLK